jgi:hypothetical protein
LKLSELLYLSFVGCWLLSQAKVSFDLSVIFRNWRIHWMILLIICPLRLENTCISIRQLFKLMELGMRVSRCSLYIRNFIITKQVIWLNIKKWFIQHLLRYKTTNGKIIDEEIERYECITYYGSDKTTLSYADKVNGYKELCK